MRATFYGIGILAIVVFIFLVAKTAAQSDIEIQTTEPINSPTITEQDVLFGNPNAKTMITMFGYVGCKNCEDTRASLINISQSSEDIAFVWKDYPNTSLAPNALSAAVASRCAQEQNRFFDFQSAIIETDETLNTEFYISTAETIGLKPRKFKSCLQNHRGSEIVQSNIEEGNQLKITVTPTIFIGENRFTGGFTQKELQQIINEEL